ncbi:MAG: hypothetical protein M1820_000352 [Bogoriella megaspora]|nr:MAG: hypothetical protein M1820_000352 [Bogoriella megaspora]
MAAAVQLTALCAQSPINRRFVDCLSKVRRIRVTARIPQIIRWNSTSSTHRPRTALFFPGQGVQKVGMLEPWIEAFPKTVKPMLDEIDSILNYPLTKIIAEGPNAKLTATEHAQPAIMAASIIMLRVLEQDFDFKTNKRVDITLGHSLGEFAAVVAAGNLDMRDSLRMVHKRGQVMAHCSKEACDKDGGEVGMVALVCEAGHLQELIDAIHGFLGHSSPGSKTDSNEDLPPVQQVLIANINSKNQIVLSGSIERIKILLTHLRQFGGHDPRAVRLKADSPFHSPLMKPAADYMRRALSNPSNSRNQDIVSWPGYMPCVSNVTARPFESRQQLKDLLARQCVETVRWWDSVKYLDQEWNIRRWIGVGPGKVGRNLVGKEVGMKGAVKGGGVWGITEPTEIEEVMKALDETECVEED